VSLRDRHLLISCLCAGFVLALGTMVLAGWVLGIPQLVQIRPDWTPMVVNTAIGFVLSGIGLFMAVQGGRWPTRIAALLGALVALLAVEELCVLLFDLAPALSLPELHRPLQPSYPHPGRMAPNTALCFLLFGVGFWALMRSQRASAARWIQRAAIAVLAIGLLGVIGYSLQLEYLYGWAGVTRMAAHTGVGMVVLGTGLWNLGVARAGVRSISDGSEVAGVYRTATLLLLLVAASAGIGGFAFLQGQVELQVDDELRQMAVDRVLLLDQVIEHRSIRAQIVSDAHELATLLRALGAAPQDQATLNALRGYATGLRKNGFSSVGANIAGRYWQFDGAPTRPALSVALQGDYPGWLLWQNGYVLRRELPVRDRAGIVGTLITEQPLQVLDIVSAAINRLGESGEMGVCSGDPINMHCFPTRNRPQPFNSPRIIAGQPLPLDYALRGKTGSIVAYDYRQHRVLAAYDPIGKTGLGLVVKRDIAEIYAPIRRQFQRIVVFLVVLLLFGQWLMRRSLGPLLWSLESSRAQARAESARFEAAVESNLDAFFVLECMRDPAGTIHDLRYVLINARGEHTIGRPRTEVIGHGMCQLIPELRSNGMLANCVRVVETGEPMAEERSAIVREGIWYHMRIVKLGDGVGITMRDITAERHASEQIKYQALHDPLTGIVNRAGFELALGKALVEAQQSGHVVAVALLDLDGFKEINDDLGHAAGDHVLQQVALRLRDCIRPDDTAARLGGDEFVLVLANVQYPHGAEVVARKLVAQVARSMRVDGHSIAVTVSIGISAYPQHGADALALLKCADTAMYRAKHAGRNGYALYRANVDGPEEA
jgi:diguanylate cyclase (GGDEF)-like protein